MIKKIIYGLICCVVLWYLAFNVGPWKYKEVSTQEELYEAICNTNIKGKTNLYTVSDIGTNPSADWQTIVEYDIARDAFKGSNVQAYKYIWRERDGKVYTHYKFDYGSGKLALFIADMKMNDMAEDIKNLTDYDKVKALHDYLVLQCEYTGGFASIYDALFNGKTICVGYAGTFFRVLSKAGVPVTYECGIDHAWNTVQIDGTWYNVDVTWDDRGGNQVSYDYFLKNDKDFKHEGTSVNATQSMKVEGKSAQENFDLFRNHSAMFYYGPLFLILFAILAISGVISNYIYRKKEAKKMQQRLLNERLLEESRRRMKEASYQDYDL